MPHQLKPKLFTVLKEGYTLSMFWQVWFMPLLSC